MLKWLNDRIFGRLRKENDLWRKCIVDSISVLSDKIDNNQLNGIISLHYAGQLYAFFMKNPHLLAIVLDVKAGSDVVNSNPLWLEELGWNRKEMEDSKLFGLLYPGDEERTLEAYRDVDNLKGVKVFRNRYRCKGKQANSFRIGKEDYVWLSWFTDIDYNNEDRYRLAIAKVIPKGSKEFLELQEKHP